ncbi:GNAT family N-acetyltransferase [Patescibacteria group bacterium]|nr:MAG: GNAT family N-acetyltransferase [Patescibacteria group bacterium]
MPVASMIRFLTMIPERLDEKQKSILLEEIDTILKNAWGKFERDFLEDHVFTSEQITIARISNELIGFCAINKKKILNKTVHYIEFTVIRKDFQKLGLGTRLSFLALRKIILRNIFKIISQK